MADVLPQRISPLHRRHLSLGAQMTSEKGWQRPARYASAQEEAAAVQSGAGLCDITPVGKLLLQGADIEASVRASLPGVEIPAPGGVTRQEDRHLFCRLAVDQLLLLTPPDATDDIQATMATTQQEHLRPPRRHDIRVDGPVPRRAPQPGCVEQADRLGPHAARHRRHDLHPNQPLRCAGHIGPGRLRRRAVLPHIRVAGLG